MKKQLCLQKKCATIQISSNHPENPSVRHPSGTNNPEHCKQVTKKDGTSVPRLARWLGHWCRTVEEGTWGWGRNCTFQNSLWQHQTLNPLLPKKGNCPELFYLCICQIHFSSPWCTDTKRKEHVFPNFFSPVEKHGRTPTVFRSRLRNITKFCRTDVTTNAGSSYWPGSGNKANLGTVKHLQSHFHIPDIYSSLGNFYALGPSSLLSFYSQGRKYLTEATISKYDVAQLSKKKTDSQGKTPVVNFFVWAQTHWAQMYLLRAV